MGLESENINATFWKWGDPEKSFHLNDFPKFKAFLQHEWNTELPDSFQPPDYLSLLPASDFTATDFQKTFPSLPEKQFSNGRAERLQYTFGKGYHDVIRVFTRQKVKAPDFVLFPESEQDVVHILQQCEKHQINVITFSGGSNVTGAFDAAANERILCSLNMQRMERLIEIDEHSHTATFESGIFGPALEKILNQKGFTLGHFPQSFEYSTLGGWLATRSAGQESGQYGKIEDIVLGMKIATPKGIIEHTDFPRHAGGIDLFRIFIGSEGTLGVITEAKVRIHKKPEKFQWVTALFKDFDTGSEAVRAMVQAGIHPGILRLSDSTETKMLSLMSKHEKTGFQKMLQNLMKAYLKNKGFTEPCILMMRFAIKNKSDMTAAGEAKRIAKEHHAQILPSSTSATWEENRFALPYLRDTLIEHRILIDTFETVTYWNNVNSLYHHVHQALKEKSDYFEKGGFLFCHISHVYDTGASLYFTLLTRQEKDNEEDQWLQIKDVVTTAVVEHGGAVSHHHGVGVYHRKWYLLQLHDSEKDLLNAVKTHLDANHILNPGKLFDDKAH